MSTVLLTATRGFGLHRSRRGLVRQLLAAGYRVVLATSDDRWSRELVADGAELQAVAWPRGGVRPWAELRALWQLFRVWRSLRPALVHSFNTRPGLGSCLVGRLPGCRAAVLVVTVTGLGHAFVAGGWLRRLAGSAWRLLLGRSQQVLFQNRDDAALFQAAGWLRGLAWHCVPGAGVDGALFSPRPMPSGPPTVLMAARLLRPKGVAEYLQAARLLADRGIACRCLLAGETVPGHPDAVAEAEVADAPGITWLGWQGDMVALLADAHLVVVPSWGREGVPRVLLEAMAMQRPCVAAAVAGCRDLIEDGQTGVLVPPRDAPALADAIAGLLAEPARAAAMAEAARAAVLARWDQAVLDRDQLDLYQRLLAGGAL